MKKRVKNQVLSFVLVMLLVFTNGVPFTVWAEESEAAVAVTGGEITAFTELSEEIASITVPLGTSVEHLNLPSSLVAKVYREVELNEEMDNGETLEITSKQEVLTLSVPVKEWLSSPDFDPEVMGTYIFTPVFDELWVLADDVELPTITAQVTIGIMPLISTTNIIDLSDSDIDLSAGAVASGGKYSYDNTTKVITIHSGTVTVTGTTTDRKIIVNSGVPVDVILDDVYIDVSDTISACAFALQSNATTTLTIKGSNALKSGSDAAGLNVPPTSKLTIDATDNNQKLVASGSIGGAGIGGNNSQGCGAVIIEGGYVEATASYYGRSAAAIGAGSSSSGYDITINGGYVVAKGTYAASSIGHGLYGNTTNGNITITGGTVIAIGSLNITTTTDIAADTITITGGCVYARPEAVSTQPTNGTESVYLNTLTVGNPHIGEGVAPDAIGFDSILPYNNNDVTTTNGGKLYLWLPQNSSPSARADVIVGGTIYTKEWARTGATETQTLLLIGNAMVPAITGNPQNAVYSRNSTGSPLTVTANVTDGGTLSYQWYSNSQNNTVGATPVGINSDSYTPPTNTIGTLYYYCVITNTNVSVGGQQTATTTSTIASVKINDRPTVGSITAPATVRTGSTLSLTLPTLDNNGATITTEGWETSLDGTTGWVPFNQTNAVTLADHNKFLRYTASNSVGTEYSPNKVQIKVIDKPTVGVITPPASTTAGSVLSLTLPSVNDNNDSITNEGWEVSSDSGTTWVAFNAGNPVTLAYHGFELRYVATNSVGTEYSSNTVQIKVIDKPTVGAITTPASTTAGSVVSLTLPSVNNNNDSITSEGWEVSSDSGSTWTAFNPTNPVTLADHGTELRYVATNSVGTSYSSNIVSLTVVDQPTVATITAPVAVYAGAALTLTTPTVDDHNDTITAEGWEISSDGITWIPFSPTTIMAYTHNEQHLRYYATNNVGTSYSPNTVKIKINSSGGGGYYEPVIDPIIPTIGKQNVSGKVANGVLTVTITEQMAKDAIRSAKNNLPAGKTTGGIAVAFTANGSGTWHSLTANIHAGAIKQLKEADVKYLKIGSTIIDISLDTKAIAQINQKSTGTVTLSAKKVTKLSKAATTAIGKRRAFDITISYKKNGKKTNISALGGGTATIGIAAKAPSSGTGTLYGVHVKTNGKVEWLQKSSYTGGKLVFTRSSLSVYGAGLKANNAFIDTKAHWAKDSIDFIVSRKLITGTTNVTYVPDRAISRADFAMALGKLSGANVSSYKKSSFTDVKDNDATMPYIEWAVANKIITGHENKQFSPNGTITREQMAVILQNYAKATGYKLPVARYYNTFTDNHAINYGTKDAVKAIVQAGIMASKDGNKFEPQNNATRAETAVILHRFINVMNNEENARGWVRNDSGQYQYYDGAGKLVKDTKIDGYTVDKDGVRK